MSRFQKVTAKDKEIIEAMADIVYHIIQQSFFERGMDYREAYEFICDDEAFNMIQDELEQYFNGTHK